MDVEGDYLLSVVFAIVKDKSKAEDIVQEVFIRYYLNIHEFEHRSSVRTYLYRIAVNQCRNFLKSWHFRKLEFTRQAARVLAFSKSPEELAVTTEANEELIRLIDNLPIKYKEIIWLYYYAELSVAEIGSVLACPVNTVKTRLVRGRKMLKGYLKEGKQDD